MLSCADRESFVRVFFWLIRGEGSEYHYNGPSLAYQRNAIKMALRWRADDGLTLNAGLVAV